MPRLVVSSQFFLDHAAWEQLRTDVLPALLESLSTLRVWSVGCHAGKEPYSVAILLDQCGGLNDHSILATDIDESLLARAAAGGPYSERDVATLSQHQRETYLQPGGPPHHVIDRLRSAITFRRNDVRRDDPETDIDLVLFRDVEPFNSSAVNQAIYRRLHAALRPGGVLFVGATDAVPGWNEIGYQRIGPHLYRR